MRRIGSISVLAIAGLLAVAGSASASTLAVDRGGTLRFAAAKGEVNNVDLSDPLAGQTVVTDSGSTITAGNGCMQVTPHRHCPMPAGFDQDVAIDLADGDDFAHAFKVTSGHIAIDGGAGATPSRTCPSSAPTSTAGRATTPSPCTPTSAAASTSTATRAMTRSTPSAPRVWCAGSRRRPDHAGTFVEPPAGFSAAYGGAGDDTISASGPTDMSLIDGGVGDDTVSTATFSAVALIRAAWARTRSPRSTAPA